MHHSHDGTAGGRLWTYTNGGRLALHDQVTDGTGVAVTVPSEPKRIGSYRGEYRGYRLILS